MRVKMIHRIKLKIFADYNQFYIWDPKASGKVAPEDWTDQDVKNRAKVTDHVFVLSPARNAVVPFTLEIHTSEPKFSKSEWDHIVEASIKIPSGRLEVHECTGGSHAEISLEPGTYGIRAHYQALDSISEDGLEGKDFYFAALWKDRIRPFRLIKQH